MEAALGSKALMPENGPSSETEGVDRDMDSPFVPFLEGLLLR